MKVRQLFYFLIGSGLIISASLEAYELKPSKFENEKQAFRYEHSYLALVADDFKELSAPLDTTGIGMQQKYHKSPVKAMLLSLAVPGLGQYYYGSKTKSALFLGAELTSWALHIIWHKDGEDMTADFEAYNRQHWLPERYSRYLELAYYGYTDDEDIPTAGDSARGISHHLPNTRTQQYYEMTGKYNQFAWGWDDAVLNGDSLSDYDESNPPYKIVNESTTPYSARRLLYEQMRADANSKLDNANKMITVAIVNHLISGFEAYFMTRHRNKHAAEPGLFSRLNFKADLKSFHAVKDTPYFMMTYKF